MHDRPVRSRYNNRSRLPFLQNKSICGKGCCLEWKRRKIDILRTGSYKKKSDTFGWEIEKDFNEPTLGGYLIKFEMVRNQYKDEGKKKENSYITQKIIEL